MRSLPALLTTIGLLAAGVLLLALGLFQARYRRARDLRATGDVLLGSGIAAGAAYHLTMLISE